MRLRDRISNGHLLAPTGAETRRLHIAEQALRSYVTCDVNKRACLLQGKNPETNQRLCGVPVVLTLDPSAYARALPPRIELWDATRCALHVEGSFAHPPLKRAPRIPRGFPPPSPVLTVSTARGVGHGRSRGV
eukprot:585959-Rhodomonas_salina.1